MKAYSEDLRLRVVAAVDGGMPRSAAERLVGVSRATLTRYLHLRRQTGGLAPRPRHGPPPVKTAALRAALLPRLAAAPDATLAEHCTWYQQTVGVRVSTATMSRVITRDLELDPEKKTLSASERDEAARAAWRERAGGIDPARFVWVDETGSHTSLTRTYARAPRGARAQGSAPRNHGPNRTLLSALSLAGLAAGLLIEGGVTTVTFEAYVEHVLAPALRPGQIVVLDNLQAHRSARTRRVLEARGATLWFLPSYSPDLNPIEEAFSKLKAHLRQAAARTQEALAAAIWAALAAITLVDARGYFTHCGYNETR